MRRTTLAAASLILALTAGLSGCGRIGGLGSFEPAESCALIEKDGSVQWASVETYDQGDYTEEELVSFAKERISAFNESLGREASAENTDGAEKLPVALVSGSLSDGTARLVTEYDKADRLVEFSQEIGDDTMPFTLLVTGRVASVGGDMSQVTFTDEKGNAVDGASVAADGERLAIRAEGGGLIRTEGTVLCVSEGSTLVDQSTVRTAEEGISYIILK